MATSSAHAEAGVADPAAYCRDYVRKRDYESYLIGGFYPRHLQGAFFALRAFYVSRYVLLHFITVASGRACACKFCTIESYGKLP